MLDEEIIIKRLALIKYLFKQGLGQSFQSGPIASFSILTFHDSIEMFLKLVSEHLNIKSESFSLLDYWEKISSLTLKESCRALKDRRVNIKHKGILMSVSDIEASRVTTTDFFKQNVQLQFAINFDDISVLSLVKYESVKNLLETSQFALAEKDVTKSIEHSALAFIELIKTYEISKKDWRNSPFFFGESLAFHDSIFMNIEDRKLSEFVDKVKISLESIRDAIKLISMGIDYRKYIRFKLLTPTPIYAVGGVHLAHGHIKKKWTKENCQFCIDFVVDTAIRLQDFDFSLEDLIETRQ